MKHIDAANEQEQDDELRLEDFEDFHDPEVQLQFLEIWDETGQPRQ